MSNTICAISTPYGSGGIAVVRVSGESAIQIVDTLFHGRKSLMEAKAYTVHYGEIKKPTPIPSLKGRENNEQEILDQVLVSVFRAPHSFTGEDVVEIACHGSMYIQQTLLQWLVDAGCQLAKAGEFTQRAFLNGKMDLTEAEAVADLIAAQTKAEKDLALSQLRGGISNELATLRERLLTFTSLVELELDFADHEELEFADRSELFALAQEIDTTIGNLVRSFKTGNAIKQGIPVAIIGAPNVGKSTLLNALLGEERAIVSDIQGTTRDTVEDTLVLDGMLFRFIDTAGLRQTDDTIESLGIERSRQAAQKAAVLIHLQDATQPVDILSELDDISEKPSGRSRALLLASMQTLYGSVSALRATNSSSVNRSTSPLLTTHTRQTLQQSRLSWRRWLRLQLSLSRISRSSSAVGARLVLYQSATKMSCRSNTRQCSTSSLQ